MTNFVLLETVDQRISRLSNGERVGRDLRTQQNTQWACYFYECMHKQWLSAKERIEGERENYLPFFRSCFYVFFPEDA